MQVFHGMWNLPMRQSLQAQYLYLSSSSHLYTTNTNNSSNNILLHQYALFTALCLPDDVDISRAVNASTTTTNSSNITNITNISIIDKTNTTSSLSSCNNNYDPTTTKTLLATLISKYSFELKEFRIFLYQLLGQAATHKMLIYCDGNMSGITMLHDVYVIIYKYIYKY